MIKRLSLTLLSIITISLTGCKLGTSGMWKNGSIDQRARQEIKALNDRLMDALRKNDTAGVKALLSDQLLEKAPALGNLISQVSPFLENNDYRVLDEYLVRSTTTGQNAFIPSGLSGDNDYALNFLALNKEMYVSLLIPTRQSDELLVTAIYGKYGSEWKINILYFGQYSIEGKTAPDYYKTAKERFQNKELVDAANLMYMAKLCFTPSVVWQYKRADEIKNFGEKAVVEANTAYKFPVMVDKVDTKPQIIGINPEKTQSQFFVLVSYLSNINIKDTSALRTENLKIRKEISKLFNGIDKNKPYLAYRAFNEMPDATKKTMHYGFIDTLLLH
ncbi:hypothetical protein [Pedobacter frigoris]|uniref:Lipoprotein n=1 Tax=Pedobacter frigoris TaxID=2571272 RepID=A0A4U1CPM5_9SPHI|nr:hypothetical protein [Pedobacter frigoris]TKC09443.1 hypothetical protein FA047_04950 [Pedobacter frigoris]